MADDTGGANDMGGISRKVGTGIDCRGHAAGWFTCVLAVALLACGATARGQADLPAKLELHSFDEDLQETAKDPVTYLPALELATVDRLSRPVLGLLTGEEPTWRRDVAPMPDASLYELSLLSDSGASAGGFVECDVEYTSEKGEVIPLARLQVDANAPAWATTRLDLSGHAGERGQLVVRSEVMHGKAYEVAVSLAGPYGRASAERPNVVLICLDTLSADHLGCYGYWRQTSPFLDRLAKGGTRFAACNSQAPWTSPSLFSVFTGQYPLCNWSGKRDGPATFNLRAVTLARLLSAHGYNTMGVTGGGATVPERGLAQGFNAYQTTPGWGKVPPVYDAAARWLEQHRDERFLLFFHTYEVHSPYSRRIFIGPEEDRQETAIRNYDSGIRYVDDYVQKLWQKLESLGLLDRTVVIVFADHGDDFRDVYDKEGSPVGEHGQCLYQTLLHVPMILVGPGVPAGKVIETRIQSMDIMPTVLDIAHVQVPPTVQATSLMPLLRGSASGEDYGWAYSEGPDWGPDRKAYTSGGWKLIYTPSSDESSADPADVGSSVWYGQLAPRRLFNLETDSAETRNLYSLEPEVSRQMMARIREIMRENQKLLEDSEGSFVNPGRPSRELIEQLRSLGYR